MNRNFINILLTPLLIITFTCYLLCSYFTLNKIAGTDYTKLYQSLVYFWQNKNIYSPVIIQEESKSRTLSPNLNPPFFTFLFSPLGLMSFKISAWIWSFLSILAGITSLYLIHRYYLSDFQNPISFSVLLAAFFIYFPTFAAIQFGQVTLILLLFLTIAWLALKRNHIALSGILLGLSFSIKPFFGLFAIYFLFTRHSRMLFYFLLTVMCSYGITILFFGQHALIDYHTTLEKIHWYAANWNASFYGFFTRLFGSENEANMAVISQPGWPKKAYEIIALIIIGWLFHLTRKKQRDTDLDIAFITITMLLISPLGWMYYFPLLILPFFILKTKIETTSQVNEFRILLSLILILSSLPYEYLNPAGLTQTWFILTWANSYFYALFLFMLLAGYLLVYQNDQWRLTHSIMPLKFSASLHRIIYIVVLLPSFLGILHSCLKLNLP